MFESKKVKNELVAWIRTWFENNGKGCKAVIGISGGKDSSVVAGLCVEALGKENVVGVLMPNGVQADIDCAQLLVSHLGIEHYTVNIQEGFTGIKNSLPKALELTKQASTNLAPRVRMATLYMVSQCVGGRVANTCNLSENYVGYSTRYGDDAGDFSPLANLCVREVLQIGEELGLPKELIYKVPSDGLCGKTDEDNLGFSYAVLDRYIREGVCEDEKIKERIDHLNQINAFKLKVMDSFPYQA